MRIDVEVTDRGVSRTVDFQGARLPDGRIIQEILDENERFKREIKELNEKASFLSKILPWKTVRDGVEGIMFMFGILGIILFVKGLF